MSYPYRDGLTGAEAAARAIGQIETQVGAHNVAALLIEPIQGEGGFVVPADGFLPGAVGVDDAERRASSSPTRSRAASVAPATGSPSSTRASSPTSSRTAKGLAGGMPLAGVTGRAELMNAVHEGGLGGTYGGNPVARGRVARHDRDPARPQPRRAGQGDRRHHAPAPCARSQQDVAIIGDVRGRGAMVAIELVQPGTTKPNAAAVKAGRQLLQPEGVIAISLRHVRQRVRLLPPLVDHRRATARRSQRAGRRGARGRLTNRAKPGP